MTPGPEGRDIAATRRFRMYVSGGSPNSRQALANFTVLAERYFVPYSIEVVDVLENPERAMADAVVVTPTLLLLGEPPISIIGTLSETATVLASLSGVERIAGAGETRVPLLIQHLLETEAELDTLLSGQGDAILGTRGESLLMHEAQAALQGSVAHFRGLAHRDPLTGVANRRLFASQLEHAVERSKRVQSRLALLYVDVDHFKAINDSLGHDAGDRLLRAFSERLGRCLRAADSLARVGGDEFAILLEDVAERGVAELVARKIQAAMAEPFELDGTRAHIQASIGIAFFPDNATDAEGLTGKADTAMYRAKQEGHGGFAVVE